ncbi:hypothetical protein NTHI1209_00634 [Haemophilus influenzae]|uniref:Uncharacterized protein n=1 Tax=Haemophilus influenzae TaxID=727 RepID=A0A158SVY7_HAEIF|nr:hypothetical protein NTHI1209_00634 [Haemophilus influenzae]
MLLGDIFIKSLLLISSKIHFCKDLSGNYLKKN